MYYLIHHIKIEGMTERTLINECYISKKDEYKDSYHEKKRCIKEIKDLKDETILKLYKDVQDYGIDIFKEMAINGILNSELISNEVKEKIRIDLKK